MTRKSAICAHDSSSGGTEAGFDAGLGARRVEGSRGRVFARAAASVVVLGLQASINAQVVGTWVPSSIASTNNWSALAASGDGAKLVAASYDDPAFNPGQIYVSTNSGTTWNLTGAPSNFWSGVCSSTNGEDLGAVVSGGGIYTSTNAGATWAQAQNAPYGVWYAIASSWDGSRLVAVSGGAERFVYTSPDAGQTWVSNNVPDSQVLVCRGLRRRRPATRGRFQLEHERRGRSDLHLDQRRLDLDLE